MPKSPTSRSASARPARRAPPKRQRAPAPPVQDTTIEDDNADVEARIYRAVFESVMSQRLKPGTKLPEAPLCELFGVSRSVVRKVLQKLAHDHIV